MKKGQEVVKKNDFLLVGSLVILCAASFVGYLVRFKNTGAYVTVTVDGGEYGTYALREDRSIPIVTSYGANTLVIADGACRMEEADCPDKLCIRQGSINKEGASIVCLPHRLVVTVYGGEDNDVDSMVK